MADGDSPRRDPMQILDNHNPPTTFLTRPSFSAALQSKEQEEITKVRMSHPSKIEANSEVVPFKPILQFQGKKAIFFTSVEKSELVEKLQYVLIGKFSHGRPSWAKVKEFFDDLKLSGMYTISIFDQKHLYIECSNKIDFNHIWLGLQWLVDGCAMRILKWVPHFSPGIESPIVPVWIRMEGIPLYMFEEMPLWQIANVIGKPIKIDARNQKRAMLNKARVCVELDLSEQLIDSFWVCFEEKESGVVKDYFCVKVFYDFVPSYCSVCFHVGHKMENCKSKHPCSENEDTNQLKAQMHKASVHKQWIVKSKSAAVPNTINADKGKGIMYEEAVQKRSETKGASSSVRISDIALRIDATQVAQTDQLKEMTPEIGKNVKNADREVSKKVRNVQQEVAADSEGSPLETSLQQQQIEDLDSKQNAHSKRKNEDQGQLLQQNSKQNKDNAADLEGDCERQRPAIGQNGVVDSLKLNNESKLSEGIIEYAGNPTEKEGQTEKHEVVTHTSKQGESCLAQSSQTAAEQMVTHNVPLQVHLTEQVCKSKLCSSVDDSEEEWTTVVRSKKKGKKQSTNQNDIGIKEHTMQQDLVQCTQVILEQQLASNLVQDFDRVRQISIQVTDPPKNIIEQHILQTEGNLKLQPKKSSAGNTNQHKTALKQSWAEEAETNSTDLQIPVSDQNASRMIQEKQKGHYLSGAMRKAKLNKFGNLKYCDELEKESRYQRKRSRSLPPKRVIILQVTNEMAVKTELPIDFDQIFCGPDNDEVTWAEIMDMDTNALVARRSVPPTGRTSKKLSSLSAKIDMIDFMDQKAQIWPKAVYDMERVNTRNGDNCPNTPIKQTKHSQSAPNTNKRGRGRNRGQKQRSNGKGPV